MARKKTSRKRPARATAGKPAPAGQKKKKAGKRPASSGKTKAVKKAPAAAKRSPAARKKKPAARKPAPRARRAADDGESKKPTRRMARDAIPLPLPPGTPPDPARERSLALLDAVERGDLPGIAAAIAAGADPRAIDYEEGCSPLELAAGLGHPAAVRALLEAGAPVDRGLVQSPLGAAASQGHLVVIEALLAAGAAVDAPGEDAQTPLMSAAAAGALPAVERLLEAGADPDRRSAHGDTALGLAALSGEEAVFQRLAPRTAPEERARAERLLAERTRAHSRRTARERLAGPAAELPLISQDLAVRGATEVRLSPGAFELVFPWGREEGDLLAAAELGYDGILAALLRAGSDPDEAELLGGQTPLMRAAAAGQVGATHILLAAGADAAARDRAGNGPLHHLVALPASSSSRRERAEIAAQLLAHGAPAEAGNEQGETPLHLAARWGYAEVARTLLGAGASPLAASKSGETPRQLAAGKADLEPLFI